ncbi:MAG: SHOCT domain-containing protein [Polyangiaceae bacterium]|nr:SHOCT domain-containing protein [Polyangiaceae bacterium]
MSDMKAQAKSIIDQHIVWSIGAGLMPVPILDIAAVSAIQLDMLKQLSALYGVRYTESEGKIWLSALSGSLLARIAANAVKLIPGIGSLLGGVSMAAMSGASTYALGQVAVAHFEGSGDLTNLDVASARRAYEQELEKGKEVASRMAREKKASRDVFEKLERAKELRDKGVISDDDFEAMKQKLLDQV